MPCKRCKKTDVKILSNGLCERCDEVEYGKRNNDWAKIERPPIWWESKEPSKYKIRYGARCDLHGYRKNKKDS